jgi:hypothetical protein
MTVIKIIIKIRTTQRVLQINPLKLAILLKRYKLFCVNMIFCTLLEKYIDCGISLLQIYRHILHDSTRVMTRNKICFNE